MAPLNELEQELLDLVVEERHRREATNEREVRSLSRIFEYSLRDTPQPFSSRKSLRVGSNTSIGEVVVDVPRNSRADYEIEHGENISMSVDQPVPNANGDMFISTENLSDIFMTHEARAQQNLQEQTGIDIFEEDVFHVEFNEGSLEGTTRPNEAVRFQVGRESPPPLTRMNRRALPIDGQVVRTRGEDGRFHATGPIRVAEAVVDYYDASGVTEPRRTQRSSLSSRKVGYRTQGPEKASDLPQAPRDCYRPSVLERLSGDDMFEDND